MQTGSEHICPVCGKHWFEKEDSYYLCPVCGWQDERASEELPDFCGVNQMSLNEAKKIYKVKGRIR